MVEPLAPASAAERPGVSFVVPVYDKAPWLPGVLAGIAAQRGDFDRQFVFVDDGSRDDSLAILRRETAGWANTVIETQANAGSAAATNRGIALADREYVKFVDADDLLHADATRLLLAALQADPAACLAYGRAVTYDDRAALDLETPLAAPPPVRLARPLRPAMRNSLFNPSQFLARRAALLACGGCDERIVFSQEYTLTMRLARRAPFLRLDAPVAYLPAEVPGRLGADQARQLQRVTRAVALFLRDHPDTPWRLKQAAARRMAYRAWKHLHRTEEAFWLTHPAFWRQVRAWLPMLGGHAAFIEACSRAFDGGDAHVVGYAAGGAGV